MLAKLAIGGTLCAIIVSRVDWHTASDSLAETGLGLVAVMFGILIALVFVSAYKWRLLLSIHGVEYSTLRLSKYYFVALFFNNFLPTSIGGDGYRIYKTIDNGRSKASAVIAVVMERVTGFGTLVALGTGAGALLAADAAGLLTLLGVGAALACAAATPLAWRMRLVPRRLRALVPKRLRDALPDNVRRLKETLGEHIDDYVRQPLRSFTVIVISIVFHVGLAFAFFVLLRYGADQPISMLEMMSVLALTTFVAVLPISLNGLGVYEGTFIYLLAQYGVPPDVSVVPMILNRGLLIVLSLVGAGIYVLDTAGFVSGRTARADVAR
ncbi:MAG TPA: lysylphosphatidylglycerol synthase transmembrane domain-containing protein [Gammaproteobacteria bacterium]